MDGSKLPLVLNKHFVWKIVKDIPRTRNLPARSLLQWLLVHSDFIKEFRWPERKNSSDGLDNPPTYLVIYQLLKPACYTGDL